MLFTLIKLLILPFISMILCLVGWILLYKADPVLVGLINQLLSKNYWLLGGWLSLLVIGFDYYITLIINSISYRNVGGKSKAQYYLGKNGE